MLLENHYQNAYVTRDIEQALDIFRTRYGVQDARFFQAETEVWTPQGSGIAVNKIAFIWIGELQYELIEPVSGPVELYRDAVPEQGRSEEHTSELQSLMRSSYAVFCLKKQKTQH